MTNLKSREELDFWDSQEPHFDPKAFINMDCVTDFFFKKKKKDPIKNVNDGCPRPDSLSPEALTSSQPSASGM